MPIYDLRSVLLLGVVLAYAAIAGQVIARRRVAGNGGRSLILYAAVGVAWVAFDSAGYFGRVPSWLADVLAHASLYEALSLSVIFFHLTRVFLRVSSKASTRYWLVGVWLAGAVVIDSNVLRLPNVLVQLPGWFVGRTALTQAALTLGWGLYASKSALLTARVYRRTSQPLHRNRLAYWSAAITLGVVAMAVLLIGQDVAGNLILLGAGLVATLAIMTHQLPDARQALRQATALVTAAGMAVGVYAAAIMLAPAAQRIVPGLSKPLTAVVLAIVVVVAANPLLHLVERRLLWWASGSAYDARRMIGEYGLTIGGILELDRLAGVALGLIQDAIDIESGALFVVDPPAAEPTSARFYGLRSAGVLGSSAHSGALLADSPLAAYMTQEFAPLTQYDLDLNSRFRDISAAERIWLQGLNVDVYVPIYASHQWIGLFALGPKRSRHRYFDDDLQLLSTLADQTAVALQNARLVDDLVRLNAQIQQANTALDEANQRLAHLDRIKSDFINVISHELRTPLSVLYGYGQILLSEVNQIGDEYYRQLIEGINIGTARMQEIINNMLDVTKIDSRALALSARPVPIKVVVEDVLAQLSRALAERNLAVRVDGLGSLPPVEADGAALVKVFYHLLVNAVKFTPDGGQIGITGRCLEDKLPGGAVEITIRDTGIGIDPRFLDLIFTKFYRMGEVALHSSGKTKFKGGGPGLGLTIARGIVEAHGGQLYAESTGHDEATLPGSRFVVILPLTQERDQEKQPQS